MANGIRQATLYFLVLIFLTEPSWSQSSEALSSSDCKNGAVGAKIMATVNGNPILQADVDRTIAAELRELEDKGYQLRRNALENLINQTVIEQAAQNRNLSDFDFLQQTIKVSEVSETDIREAYEKARAAPSGAQSEFEAIERIRVALQQGRRQEAYRSLIQQLRNQAAIEVYLQRPRVTYERIESPQDPALGLRDAPLTIVMFSDFECPYCRASQQTMREFMKLYRGKANQLPPA
jgi:hypothetical protein